MNIRDVAKKWLVEHEHYEDEPCFEDDLASLCKVLEEMMDYEGYVGYEPEYDPKFGDDRLCLCRHPYYRHFDTYSNMDPVGCKYCCWGDEGEYGDKICGGFKEKKECEHNWVMDGHNAGEPICSKCYKRE